MNLIGLVMVELGILFVLSFFVRNALNIILFLLFKNKTARLILLTLILLPGTIIHELGHLFAAAILLVRVGNISLLPSWEQLSKGGPQLVLGHVQIAKTDPFRRYLVGFAPVISGLIFICILVWSLEKIWPSFNSLIGQVLLSLLYCYLIFAVSNTMFSSKKDLEGFIVFAPVLVAIALVWYVSGFSVNIPDKSAATISFGLEKLSLILGMVIGINVLILILSLVVRKGVMNLKNYQRIRIT